ncbi:MAG: HIT family protein [Actinomadura sp.]
MIVTRDEVIHRLTRSACGAGAADCVLCPPLRFRFNDIAELPGAAGVLCGDGDFYVAPDLAPVVEGHLLLVSSAHWTCSAAFPERLWASAVRWRDRVARIYLEAYGTGEVVVLEHGPARPQGAGSCIDHAHWHLLPGAPGVRAAVEGHGLTGVPASHEAARALLAAGRSYLLVEEGGTGLLYTPREVPGQFLRLAAVTAFGTRRGAGLRVGTEVAWRWQETFGESASRRRFLATLDALLPAAERLQDTSS